MLNKTKTAGEVLVIGAGPVGMFTALRLAQNGISVQLIDAESGPAGHSCACALHPHTLQLLDEVGIACDAIKLGHRIEKVAFYDGNLRRADLDLTQLPVEFPFVLVLQQNLLESLLEQKLKENGGIEVRWNHRLADLTMTSGGASATIDELAMSGKGYGFADFDMEIKKTKTECADFVVGADGQGSIVRQRLAIDYEPVGKSELFVVYEFETDTMLPPEVRIVLDRDTVNVLWPFTETTGRWSFQWLPANPPSDFQKKSRSPFTVVDSPGPDDSRHHLMKLLGARAPWFKGCIKEVGWATDIQFEHKLAGRFGRGRAWLAGDAAHQTGPIGMQSMNVGFREGADLTAKLSSILREKGSPDLLKTYDFERQVEWERLLGWKGNIKTSLSTDKWLKDNCLRIPSCIPATGNELTLLLRQLGIEFEYTNLQQVGV